MRQKCFVLLPQIMGQKQTQQCFVKIAIFHEIDRFPVQDSNLTALVYSLVAQSLT